MRGTDRETGKLFSYASPDSLVPEDHPLRAIRALVNGALERLSPLERAAFLLHDVEGFEHREIAQILGISEGTSKSQVHKARMKLRMILRR